MFDMELGKQLATTHFISSLYLGNLVVSAILELVSCKRTLPDLCLADHNSYKFIHYLKRSTGIFLRMIHETVFSLGKDSGFKIRSF